MLISRIFASRNAFKSSKNIESCDVSDKASTNSYRRWLPENCPLKTLASHAASCRELRWQIGYVRFLCAGWFKHQLPLHFEANERIRLGIVVCQGTASDSMSVVRAANKARLLTCGPHGRISTFKRRIPRRCRRRGLGRIRHVPLAPPSSCKCYFLKRRRAIGYENSRSECGASS